MKMRQSAIVMFVVLCLLSLSADVFAADKVRGNIGVGVGSGTTAYGLSAKLYMGDGFAIQPVIGARHGRIGLSVDALIEMPALFNAGPFELAWSLGAGGGLAIGDGGLALGIAGVIGLEFNFSIIPSLPFDFVVEYRPNLFVVPSVNLDLIDFSGHVRVYF